MVERFGGAGVVDFTSDLWTTDYEGNHDLILTFRITLLVLYCSTLMIYLFVITCFLGNTRCNVVN